MTTDAALTQKETARARQYTYYWLGRLLREGVTVETKAVVGNIPELAQLLPQPFDADSAAADHQALFGFNLFPYEGVFLDPSAQLGGPATDRVLRTFGDLGYRPPTASVSGDHLGCQLDLLAFLSAAEADALDDGLAGEAARISTLSRDYLDQHLLRWLAPLQAAAAACATPFYGRLLEMIAGVVLAQRQALGGPLHLEPLPEAPDLLDGDRVRLRDIAVYLLTPVHSGLYLTRDDIAGLARALDLPRGFGSREQLLLNLLRSAAQYESASALVALLAQLFEARRTTYVAQSAAWAPLQPVWEMWAARSAATRRVLETMEVQVAALAAQDEA